MKTATKNWMDESSGLILFVQVHFGIEPEVFVLNQFCPKDDLARVVRVVLNYVNDDSSGGKLIGLDGMFPQHVVFVEITDDGDGRIECRF